MELLPATQIAEAIIEKLAPYCKIINIAGSIRRQKTEVKDIELVVLPKKEVVAKAPVEEKKAPVKKAPAVKKETTKKAPAKK